MLLKCRKGYWKARLLLHTDREELRAILEMAVTEADVALAGMGNCNCGVHVCLWWAKFWSVLVLTFNHRILTGLPIKRTME